MKKRNSLVLIIAVASLIALILTSGIVYHITVELPRKREQEEWAKTYNELYAERLDRYAEENRLYKEYEVDVAFLGDSITEGYDIESYYSEYKVLNRGIGGDTTHGLLSRLDVSVLDVKPKVCVMLIGANNIDTMFEDYEEIVLTVKEKLPETKIVIVSLSPTSDPIAERNPTIAYNNVKLKLLAEKHGCEFADIHTPLFDLESGKLKAEYTPDGIHHTAEGYRVITEVVKPIVDELLK